MTVYIRMAHGARGARVAASTTPNYEPLYSGSGYQGKPLPTAAFALRLDVPEALFERASQALAEIVVSEGQAEIAAEVRDLVA